MMKHGVDDWILDETELAEHYRATGKIEYAENKMELVGLLEQLKEYQQLEEQGRLIKLPCKVGDTVYHVVQGRIVEVSNVDLFFLLLSVVENRFNNSVFLTKSAAEEKLKELRGGENGSME